MRRRACLARLAASIAVGPTSVPVLGFAAPMVSDEDRRRGRDLAREVGVTTGSFVRHLGATTNDRTLSIFDLPRIMRDQLDMRVIDLMTATLPDLSEATCERLRNAAEQHGCVLTNLKMNQKGLDLGTLDDALWNKSLDVYRRTIDAAARLGVRWVRPLPGPARPNLERLVAGYRALIEYAGERNIGLLIENFGWMSNDPEAVPRLAAAIGPEVGVQPDTGNWTAAARYAGLEKAFPLAVSCDFKALQLDADGGHAAYDLKKCFDIAWRAGFRGPWCLEHFHERLGPLWDEMRLLRDRLRSWMAAAS